MTQPNESYEQALIDPISVYARPTQVLQDRTLNNAQKLKILRRWEVDARELQVAEEEGMLGGEDDLFTEVLQAIGTLTPTTKGATDTRKAPTKQGGSH